MEAEFEFEFKSEICSDLYTCIRDLHTGRTPGGLVRAEFEFESEFEMDV